jgi:PAT family beta-lactamase induction signal transducer AmpG
VAIFGIAYGFYETVYFAVSMRETDPRIAASMFSILMAIANLGTGVGLAMSGALANSLGFRPAFAIIAALNLAAIPLLPLIFPRKKAV